jgi:hypothetical protein
MIFGRKAIPQDLYGYKPTPSARDVAFAEKHGGTSDDILMLQSGAMEYVVLFKSLAETIESLKQGKLENMQAQGWEV